MLDMSLLRATSSMLGWVGLNAAKTSSHSHTAEFWAPAESHAFTFKVWTATRFFSKVHSDPKASHTSLCAQGEGTEWNALGEIYVLVPGCWIFWAFGFACIVPCFTSQHFAGRPSLGLSVLLLPERQEDSQPLGSWWGHCSMTCCHHQCVDMLPPHPFAEWEEQVSVYRF